MNARARKILAAVFVVALWISCLILLVSGLIGRSADPLIAWMETWGTAIAFWCGAGACGWRAFSGDRPGPWRWAAAACALWAYANTYYAIMIAPAVAPIPSPLDIGYALFPVALGIALIEFARARAVRLSRDMLLDAAVVALATAAVITAVMFGAMPAHTASLASLITTVLYPVEDIVVLSMVVGLGSMLDWRLGRDVALFGLGVVAIMVADVLASSNVLGGGSNEGAWTNLGWTLGIALLALAALLGGRGDQSRTHEAPHVTRSMIVVPIGFGLIAIGVLVLTKPLDLPLAVLPLGALALMTGLIRLYLLFHEAVALAESRRLSLTDDLTGLSNRRQLMHDLTTAFARRDRLVLGMFDLDGFKRFNDTYGRVAGDELLRELALRAAAAATAAATVYRLGGDEFCVIAPERSASDAAIEQVRAALQAHGSGWLISASAGVVAIPGEAPNPVAALQLADRRMYAQKARRPDAARRQVGDVLLSAISLQQPWLDHHTSNATMLVVALARKLGLNEDEVDDIMRAGELHDVGKLAIPLEILNKPGPLDAEEWEIIKRHTVIGDEMLRAAPALAPIAPLVRASHERWDGTGYPDQLAGDAIPLGARIVAVCDAFDAMVSDRPYRDGIPAAAAAAEIARCAGTQFDPSVAAAFVELQAEIAADQTAALVDNSPAAADGRGSSAALEGHVGEHKAVALDARANGHRDR
ncbi:MAG: diguanylate cyclase [Acidobacteriota bacterium]|nr:diguanylate cyclase [Acidobacteriota bacterium]